MIIKKEKDRKFYNSKTKNYVTLKQIFQYVRKGVDFKVIDLHNQDITLETKSSAIMKHSSKEELNLILKSQNILSAHKQEIITNIFNLGFTKTKEAFQTNPSVAPYIMQLHIDLIKSL